MPYRVKPGPPAANAVMATPVLPVAPVVAAQPQATFAVAVPPGAAPGTQMQVTRRGGSSPIASHFHFLACKV